jgi:DNA topoisomerase IA
MKENKLFIIKRGRKQADKLAPIDDDPYFTPEMIAKIERSMQQAKEGKVTRITGIDELNKYLNNL